MKEPLVPLAKQMEQRFQGIHTAIERFKVRIAMAHEFLDSDEGMEEAMIEALKERGYEVNESV